MCALIGLAFKMRGATNAIRSIIAKGVDPQNLTVVTHSSGNHAQALALAARQLGVRCHVVMPSTAPSVKVAAVRGYGAFITQCEPTLISRKTTAEDVMKKEQLLGAGRMIEFIPPYDDVRVIAGQGTMAIEFLEQAEELGNKLDILITPVGGGGMLSGCAVAAKGMRPDVIVVGAEPLNANDAQQAFRSKQFVEALPANTIADGLLTSLGDYTFPLILEHVDEILTVTEDQIMYVTPSHGQ
jgi:threonine dehydratase